MIELGLLGLSIVLLEYVRRTSEKAEREADREYWLNLGIKK